MQGLYIVNYCNPNCTPLQSITRLPEAEAFELAKKLSEQYKGTAFYRFADFVNYYLRRIRTEKWLYDWFIKLGGEPETKHPLYFVLQGSDYLHEWFDRGEITRIPLSIINEKHISFTLGDSMAKMDQPERRNPFLKDTLFEIISQVWRY
ncbi:MAG: hypothetical protein GX085_03570 [Firmicutes bacterium]|nr:hypothetical protein [Bacillota bacterium]